MPIALCSGSTISGRIDVLQHSSFQGGDWSPAIAQAGSFVGFPGGRRSHSLAGSSPAPCSASLDWRSGCWHTRHGKAPSTNRAKPKG